MGCGLQSRAALGRILTSFRSWAMHSAGGMTGSQLGMLSHSFQLDSWHCTVLGKFLKPNRSKTQLANTRRGKFRPHGREVKKKCGPQYLAVVLGTRFNRVKHLQFNMITMPYRWANQSWTERFCSLYRYSYLIEAYGSPGKYLVVCWGAAVHLFNVNFIFLSGGIPAALNEWQVLRVFSTVMDRCRAAKD
jgi:hypothetical protein